MKWFMSREQWMAQDARQEIDPLITPATHVFFMDTFVQHCDTVEKCTYNMRMIQNTDLTRMYHRDIRYNFMVGGDGVVYEGRGWTSRGILPSRFKQLLPTSIVVGFMGVVEDGGLSKVMSEASQLLIDFGIQNKFIHKDYKLVNLFRNFAEK